MGQPEGVRGHKGEPEMVALVTKPKSKPVFMTETYKEVRRELLVNV